MNGRQVGLLCQVNVRHSAVYNSSLIYPFVSFTSYSTGHLRACVDLGNDKCSRWNRIFSSAGWTFHISWRKCLSVCMCVDVCLDVNHGGTNRNHCTQRLEILHAQTYKWTLMTHQKLGQHDLLYGSKSPTGKVQIFHHEMDAMGVTVHGLLVAKKLIRYSLL